MYNTKKIKDMTPEERRQYNLAAVRRRREKEEYDLIPLTFKENDLAIIICALRESIKVFKKEVSSPEDEVTLEQMEKLYKRLDDKL